MCPNSTLDISPRSGASRGFSASLWDNYGTKRRRRKKRLKANTFLFTEKSIDNIKSTGKRKRYWDTKVAGLVLEVMASGTKIYRYCRMVNAKQQWDTVGAHSTITLEAARNQAVVLSARLIEGSDFAGERKAKREELTVKDLGGLYFDHYANERCETADEMRKCFFRWYASEFDKPLSEITVKSLQLFINQLAGGKHYYRANRALELIKAMFNWGIRKGFCSENPANKVDSFKEIPRERFIQPHEFEPLMRAVMAYPDDRVRDYVLLSLYTGARKSNVLSMRWDQINFTFGTWTIPRTKNGDSQTIALSDAALDILEARKKAVKGTLIPWVFPGGGKGGVGNSGHLRDPKKGWLSICKKAEIKDLRLHDLRRSAGSYAVMAGASTAVVQKMLGHKSLQAASVYQRVANDPARKAMNDALKLMRAMANEAEPGRERDARQLSGDEILSASG